MRHNVRNAALLLVVLIWCGAPVAYTADCNRNGIPDADDVRPIFSLGGPHLVDAFAGKLALADWDGDGRKDILTTGRMGDWRVALTPNEGSRTFGSAIAIEVSVWLGDPAIADFNKDGILDLAGGGTNVHLYLGRGGGLLDEVMLLAEEGDFTVVTARDVDGDGDTDIVAGDEGDDAAPQVVVFLNGGNATFVESGRYAMHGEATDLYVEDLSGDGNVDIAVANKRSGSIAILIGSGGGVFEETQFVEAGNNPVGIGFVDLGADGDLDLVVANASRHQLTVLLNRGDGSFESGEVIPLNFQYPDAIQTLDVNGDGQADLVVSGHSPDGSILIFLNDGEGRLERGGSYALSEEPHILEAADLDGDGLEDLVVANTTNTAYVAVLWNQGGGMFRAPEMRRSGGTGPLEAADLDNDEYADLAMLHAGRVTVHWGSEDGYSLAYDWYLGDADRFAIGDFDNDGRLDMAGVGGRDEAVAMLWNKGGRRFEPLQWHALDAPGAEPVSLAAADYDGDGDQDLAVGCEASAEVRFIFNRGVRTLENIAVYGLEYRVRSMASADADGDGDIDLVAHQGSQVAILENGGSGVFATTYVETEKRSSRVVAADLDGDGTDEILGTGSFSGMLILWRLSAGRYREELLQGVERDAELRVGDLDADGDTDLVRIPRSGDVLPAFLNDGRGRFSEEVTLFWGEDPRDAVLCDVDADGFLDIALGVAGGVLGSLVVVRNESVPGASLDTNRNAVPDECETPFRRADVTADGRVGIGDAVAAAHFLFSGYAVSCEATADVNADGRLDVADPVYLLAYLFQLGPPPPPPFRDCGLSTNGSERSCEDSPACP